MLTQNNYLLKSYTYLHVTFSIIITDFLCYQFLFKINFIQLLFHYLAINPLTGNVYSLSEN